MNLQRMGLPSQAPPVLSANRRLGDTQPGLPYFKNLLTNCSRRALGAAGESYAAALLKDSGYEVSFTKIGEMRGDLRAVHRETGEVHAVEVKTARRSKDNKWRFTLYLKNKIDHRHSDTVILLAVLKYGNVIPFVIPITILANQRQAVITSHPEIYAGKLAAYRTYGAIEL